MCTLHFVLDHEVYCKIWHFLLIELICPGWPYSTVSPSATPAPLPWSVHTMENRGSICYVLSTYFLLTRYFPIFSILLSASFFSITLTMLFHPFSSFFPLNPPVFFQVWFRDIQARWPVSSIHIKVSERSDFWNSFFCFHNRWHMSYCCKR